jgi:hypothetical protein
MNELNLLKRITYIRDDLIEEAFLPNAVPVAPVRPRGLLWGVAAKVAAACTVGVISLGLFLGLGLPAYREWREQMTTDETEQETPAESASETEPPVTVDFEVEVTPTVVRAGESVIVTVKATFSEPLELVPRYRIYFTYGTIPVDEEILSYAPSEEDPFTVAIPVNAPVGEYDLTVSCEGFEQEKTFEKLLTVTEREGTTENPYVWLNTDTGIIYPYQHSSGGQYIRPGIYGELMKTWTLIYADGLTYFNSYQYDVTMLPTVVYREGITLHYGETVYDKRTITVYNQKEEYIKKFDPSDLYSEIEQLPSGVYYFSIEGSFLGIDHYEEVMAVTKEWDEIWQQGQYEQDIIKAQYEEDPLMFRDKHYCDHMLRVIIP